MEIAVTGGNGRLGRAVTAQLLQKGYAIRSLDWHPPREVLLDDRVTSINVDLTHLDDVTGALDGCGAVIHLAAYTGPTGQAPGVVYRNNTISSYNVLWASSQLGIEKVCLASSINALGGIGSLVGRFDYFPVDERHPTYNADDYSLSKWVMEAQGDSFARRFPQMTISSLRLHALPDEPPVLQHTLDSAEEPGARGLWGWTLMSEGARSCVLAAEATFRGHEVFFVTAPRTCSSVPSLDLAKHAYPNVPIRSPLPGRASFYDCGKAARLLGWIHPEV